GLPGQSGGVAVEGSLGPERRPPATDSSVEPGGHRAGSDRSRLDSEVIAEPGPADVTSSTARRGGADLKQEVEPQLTERPPRHSSFEETQRLPDDLPGLPQRLGPDPHPQGAHAEQLPRWTTRSTTSTPPSATSTSTRTCSARASPPRNRCPAPTR